jgi:hypothetical protein
VGDREIILEFNFFWRWMDKASLQNFTKGWWTAALGFAGPGNFFEVWQLAPVSGFRNTLTARRWDSN